MIADAIVWAVIALVWGVVGVIGLAMFISALIYMWPLFAIIVFVGIPTAVVSRFSHEP
jgi:hypothetical protein